MEKVITTSMEHTQESDWLRKLVVECMDLNARNHEADPSDDPICSICHERVVELALRKEYDLISDILLARAYWALIRSVEVL